MITRKMSGRHRHAEEDGSTGLYVAVAAAAAAGAVVKTVVDKFNDDESAVEKFDRAFEILIQRFNSLDDPTQATARATSLEKVKNWVHNKMSAHAKASVEPAADQWPRHSHFGTWARFPVHPRVTRQLSVQGRKGSLRGQRDEYGRGAAAAGGGDAEARGVGE
jgi:hypothetical protein